MNTKQIVWVVVLGGMLGSPGFLHAGQVPDGKEMLEAQKYGKNRPEVSVLEVKEEAESVAVKAGQVKYESTAAFLMQGPLQPADPEGAEQEAEDRGNKNRPNRGDPKTDYDQWENCQHGKSGNCLSAEPGEEDGSNDDSAEEGDEGSSGDEGEVTDPGDTGDGSEEQEEPLYDVSDWVTHNKGQMGYNIIMRPEGWTDGQLVQFHVVYDLAQGPDAVVSIDMLTITLIYEVPDLSETSPNPEISVGSDGVRKEVYTFDDAPDKIILFYDASGNFIDGATYFWQELTLDQVVLPEFPPHWYEDYLRNPDNYRFLEFDAYDVRAY